MVEFLGGKDVFAILSTRLKQKSVVFASSGMIFTYLTVAAPDWLLPLLTTVQSLISPRNVLNGWRLNSWKGRQIYRVKQIC